MPTFSRILATNCIVSGFWIFSLSLLSSPAQALMLLGDTIPSQQLNGTVKYRDGGGLFLSNNAQQNEDSAIGNQVGNIYNLSGNFIGSNFGNSSIPAFNLESALGLSDGFLSPDIDNFIEAIEGSIITQRLVFPDKIKYTFGWTFFTNEGVIPANLKPDYAFALIRNTNDPLNPEFIVLSSSTDAELVNSTTTFNDAIIAPFLKENSGRIIRDFAPGTYDISFGVVDVIDGDDTSALAVWVPDYGDHKFVYRTLRKDDGARYLESELQRLGIYKDDEIDGQPDPNAFRDDLSDLDGFSVQKDIGDEDGVVFGGSSATGFWADVTFNINRLYDPNRPEASDYQLRAWFNRALLIDDLLRLAPGLIPSDPEVIPEPNFPNLFRKRYFLPFDPSKTYSRFRLTWNPINLNVQSFGEFFSQGDNQISHGEVEDYPCVEGQGNNQSVCTPPPPVPEPNSLLGLFGVGIYGLFKKTIHERILCRYLRR